MPARFGILRNFPLTGRSRIAISIMKFDKTPAQLFMNQSNGRGGMQLESLKIFCDVVRWASFSRGAAENGISQSSASQAVHQLELRLGVKLIDRSKRPLVLTPHGKVIYEGCKDLVGRYLEVENRVKALEDEAQRRRDGRGGLDLLGRAAPHEPVRPDVRRALPRGERPAGVPAPDPRASRASASGGAELGLISFPRKWPELNVIPWREEEMVLAVHPSHRFAGRRAVPVARAGRRDVRQLRCRPVDPAGHRPVPAASRRAGRCRRWSSTTSRTSSAPSRSRRGSRSCPSRPLAREVEAGTLVAVRIDGQDPAHRLTRPLAIIHRRHRQLEPDGGASSSKLLTAEDAGPRRSLPASPAVRRPTPNTSEPERTAVSRGELSSGRDRRRLRAAARADTPPSIRARTRPRIVPSPADRNRHRPPIWTIRRAEPAGDTTGPPSERNAMP